MTTPDFADHPVRPIASARLERGGIVHVAWPDGITHDAYAVWLYEQTVGIDAVTREATIDPAALPNHDHLVDVAVDPAGHLRLSWADGSTSTVDSGWLRCVADARHLPRASVGDRVLWTAEQLGSVPTFSAPDVMTRDADLADWLTALATFGAARLSDAPTDDGAAAAIAARIGPIRGSNFGGVFTVEAAAQPDSTANTGVGLGQHTDLPTREIPPGFQFLHCVRNEVSGGRSRLTDGLAVVERLRRDHPDHFDALTTIEWVFANRSPFEDHRWIGPIIDGGSGRTPLTIRGFYPVRLAPIAPVEEQARAYAALRTFSAIAHDPRLMITTEFRPGDVIGFDNRRVLHGRDPFDPGTGARRLRGWYTDHDDLYSRLRVLRRPTGVRSPA